LQATESEAVTIYQHFFTSFLPFCKKMKDKKKDHDTVDEKDHATVDEPSLE